MLIVFVYMQIQIFALDKYAFLNLSVDGVDNLIIK